MNSPVALSPIDLFFSGPDSQPSNMAFWFPGRLDARVLEESLAALAAIYFPIRGRLVQEDPTRLVLSDFDRPPVLEVVEVESLEDELSLLDGFEIASNLPGGTLLKLRLVRSPTQSALLFSFSHVLGDAAAFFDLVMDWVLLAQGRKIEPPSFDREVFRRICEAMKFDPRKLGSGAGLAKQNHGFIGEGARTMARREDFVGVIRESYSREQVAALRQACSDGDRPATVFSALAGEAWLRKARGNEAPETALVCPVDLRRVLPEIPPRFFGNAIKGVSVIKRTADVIAASPRDRAEWIMAAVRSVTREHLNLDFHVLDFMRKMRGTKAVQQLRASTSTSLLVSDLTFAPIRFVRFGELRCTRVSLLSFYANSAAILETGEGHELVRAKLKGRDA